MILHCPICGGELVDVGNYKYDCPEECLPQAVEQSELDDENND